METQATSRVGSSVSVSCTRVESRAATDIVVEVQAKTFHEGILPCVAKRFERGGKVRGLAGEVYVKAARWYGEGVVKFDFLFACQGSDFNLVQQAVQLPSPSVLHRAVQ